MMKALLNPQLLRSAILMSLTLGLAPFFPEPHVLGKLRWVLGGAVGMQGMDWFDLVLHGAPWLLLIVVGSVQLINRIKPLEN